MPISATPGGATFDPTGTYRYRLWRTIGPGDEAITFVMLNPSTADASHDDPTIRRAIGFARAWGYSRLDVVNLFACRTSSPHILMAVDDPIGPDNDIHILQAVTHSQFVIAAWGCHGRHRGRDVTVLQMLRRHCMPHYLALTRNGHPGHPLYLRRSVTPVPWIS